MIRRVGTLGLAVVAAIAVVGCSAAASSTATSVQSSTEALNVQSGRIFFTWGGIGPGATLPFIVPTSRIDVQYTFDCSSMGSLSVAGAFSASLVQYQSGVPGPTETIANVKGTSGGSQVGLAVPHPGDHYYVGVQSRCRWMVIISKG